MVREEQSGEQGTRMHGASATNVRSYGTFIEATVCLIFLAVQALMIPTGGISLDWLIRINTIFLLWLFFAAWKRFEGGMHICFLFIGTLLLFQAGRLIAFTLNPLLGSAPGLMDPFRFVLMRDIPFDVGKYIAEMTMLTITSSAVFIYLPCSLSFAPARLPDPPSPALMRGLYRIYFLTFPFLLYKNISYFLYIRAHGGYLALYLIRDQILSSVNIVVRLLSLLASLAFIVIFLFERKRRRIYLITTTYFIVSVLDLLIGMRGKVFTLVLGLWFLQNLKMGRRFHLVKIMVPGILMAYIAMFAANFRENQNLQLLSPLGFVSGQGISMQVTEAVVGFSRGFVHSPYIYLVHEMETLIIPETQVSEPSGVSLAGDLTVYLSPRAAAEGYGAGSSYIAEAYLFGGLFGVIIVSFIIGCCFAWMHSYCKTILGSLLLAFTIPSLIYLPRSTLLDPMGTAFKTFIALVLAFPFYFAITRIPKVSLFKAFRRKTPSEG